MVLKRLRDTLQHIGGPLEEVPALIIDLDPVSVSISTSNITKSVTEQLRSQIVELLPRAQLLRFEDVVRPEDIYSPWMPGRVTTSLWEHVPDFIVPVSIRRDIDAE